MPSVVAIYILRAETISNATGRHTDVDPTSDNVIEGKIGADMLSPIRTLVSEPFEIAISLVAIINRPRGVYAVDAVHALSCPNNLFAYRLLCPPWVCLRGQPGRQGFCTRSPVSRPSSLPECNWLAFFRSLLVVSRLSNWAMAVQVLVEE